MVLVNPVLKDATAGFNLRTTKAVLDFVANDGLENREFVNSKKWENNPDKNNPIIVDAYEFTTISRRGYIAFFKNATTQKWIIKSLHLSDQRNPAMAIALAKAGLVERPKQE